MQHHKKKITHQYLWFLLVHYYIDAPVSWHLGGRWDLVPFCGATVYTALASGLEGIHVQVTKRSAALLFQKGLYGGFQNILKTLNLKKGSMQCVSYIYINVGYNSS